MSRDLRAVFTLANAFKEGDLSVGGTRDDRVREEARTELLRTPVAEIRRTVFVDDGVTAALDRGRDRSRDADLDVLTVARLKEIVLGPHGPAWAAAHRHALPSEVAAALAKVLTDAELAAVSRRLFNPLAADGSEPVAIGSPRHFGSRIQPNSPGDDEDEILFSILEGLTYGCGDVIIGLNPAADELDTIVRLEALLERVVRQLDLPTRYCVLSDIVKQHAARVRTRVDVGFQSLAGTSSALAGMVALDVDGLLELARGFDGLYFETGQGSAVTNGAAEGIDMVTLEARAYGLARHVQAQTRAWMIVNDVAGFIGPEVFRTPAQLERACLEDLVMAKLQGLTMGLDVCSTFHMGVPPAELAAVTERVVERAAPAYLMAVAGNADPMLGYLTTACRDHPRLRRQTGRAIGSALERRLAALDARDTAALYAVYAKGGGDMRSVAALEEDGRRRVAELRGRGFDLGATATESAARLDTIYQHARQALYAVVDPAVVRDVCASAISVRTEAADRDAYLAQPPTGERLRPDDAASLRAAFPARRPRIQLVISDGLNANAINEQLRAFVPALQRLGRDAGLDIGETAVLVRNGRVRVGYHIGAILEPDLIVHIIGERPGTGLNTMSAYLTYGRSPGGRLRWDPGLDHSCTTAICGIHPKGKQPAAAAQEVARTLTRILDQRCSGVALR